MSSPMFYVDKYLTKKNETKPNYWIIYSDYNFINNFNSYFPTEFNLYLKLRNEKYFEFSLIKEKLFMINIYNISLEFLKNISN